MAGPPCIQVGFSTNLARLMESAPDHYSNLSGMELVRKKVRLLTVMAGNFAATNLEYNVMTDIPAAAKLFASWPTEIYISGFGGRERPFCIPLPALSTTFPKAIPSPKHTGFYAKMPYLLPPPGT